MEPLPTSIVIPFFPLLVSCQIGKYDITVKTARSITGRSSHNIISIIRNKKNSSTLLEFSSSIFFRPNVVTLLIQFQQESLGRSIFKTGRRPSYNITAIRRSEEHT